MQKLESMGLKGLLKTPQAIPPSETVKVREIPALTSIPPLGARTLSLSEAQSITKTAAPSTGETVPRPTSIPPSVESPVGVRAAQCDDSGRTWVSEAKAKGGNLPNGNFIFRDRYGNVHRLDIGELACHRARRAALYGEPLRSKGGRQTADREIRSFSGSWNAGNSRASLLHTLRRLAELTPQELATVDPEVIRRVREKLESVIR